MQEDMQSFVVRIWHEAVDLDGNPVAWRGSVDHVGSAQRRYFHDLDKVIEFIKEQVGIDPMRSDNPAVWEKRLENHDRP